MSKIEALKDLSNLSSITRNVMELIFEMRSAGSPKLKITITHYTVFLRNLKFEWKEQIHSYIRMGSILF